jgi:hypothetical protein
VILVVELLIKQYFCTGHVAPFDHTHILSIHNRPSLSSDAVFMGRAYLNNSEPVAPKFVCIWPADVDRRWFHHEQGEGIPVVKYSGVKFCCIIFGNDESWNWQMLDYCVQKIL